VGSWHEGGSSNFYAAQEEQRGIDDHDERVDLIKQKEDLIINF